MQIPSGSRVTLVRGDYDVPVGSEGVVVRWDHGDSDFYTYEVDFTVGEKTVRLYEVWDHHLRRML